MADAQPEVRVTITHLFINARVANANSEYLKECSICKGMLYEKVLGADTEESKVVQGKCHHYFHSECLNGWIAKSNKCPHCGAAWSKMGDSFYIK
ncbi:RING-box protein 2 [Angomonas deanei]|nr:RING-box protein 2 [Angomonas deanei]|eukprot:EPY21317.1 RING-box protein 2 [Angomonas deanei]